MPMINSESTTQVVYGTFRLKKNAPAYAARLEGFCMDNACGITRHTHAKLRDPKVKADSEIGKLYSWLDTLPKFIDHFHAPNHAETDTLCQRECQPSNYPELTTNTDTEAVEQLNTWLSRFKRMVNHMGFNKANYFILEMIIAHNENGLTEDVMSSDFMPSERFAEVRAAYGLTSFSNELEDSPASRSEVARVLLEGKQGGWSKERLQRHRQSVGGAWRDLFSKRTSRKRKQILT